MEHPEDYKLRKRYEADRASGIAPGSMAQWMNDTAFKGLTTKLEAPRERIIAQVEAHRERIIAQVEGERRKEPHTYGDFIREIAKANSDIAKYKDVPENLQNSYRVKLNKQFDDLVDRGYFSERSRGEWISRELSNYLWSEEYKTARDNLSEATKRLRKYEKLKEDWETDNKELIEAERLRTKREELLSADPETLRALGITPPPVQKVSRAEEVGESVKSNDDLMSHDEYLAGLVKIRETKNYGRYK